MLYLGAMCIMLEDLGFSKIPPPRNKIHLPMTYHCHIGHEYQRIYAEINNIVIIELFLKKIELSLDKWRLDQECGLYVTIEDLNFNLYDPNSIPQVTAYIEQVIIDN
jgi:hypothetical protein